MKAEKEFKEEITAQNKSAESLVLLCMCMLAGFRAEVGDGGAIRRAYVSQGLGQVPSAAPGKPTPSPFKP